MSRWYENCYRRCLVDMHIDDWNPEFFSRLDSKEYVKMMKTGHIQNAMIYAQSCVGLCNWPTKVGKTHGGLKGKDIFGEIVSECNAEEIFPTAYYSLIYDNWAYENYPDWRIINIDGKASREGGVAKGMFSGSRYGYCCPNSDGYREYTANQLKDLCSSYDIKGIFLDMTCWPVVCYCDNCAKRFFEETGCQLPRTIDWTDPVWRQFQKSREEWMGEFAEFATSCVHEVRPDITVAHQFSTAVWPWMLGVAEDISNASDYCTGDFYGDYYRHSFVCKMYQSFTKNMPFEFFTSRCVNLQDHTSMKSEGEMVLSNNIVMAHNGAFVMIDAVDPAGTLNPRVYELMGNVNRKSECFEPELGGNLVSDVGVYVSMRSKMDWEQNGSQNMDIRWELFPHLKAAVEATHTLIEEHIPVSVIGTNQLDSLNQYQVIVLPELLEVSNREAEQFRRYVEAGGCLYASGKTGQTQLSELFGILPEGIFREKISYLASSEIGKEWFPDIDAAYPLSISYHQVKAVSSSETQQLAWITLPYTDPEDSSRFASIHSNPPGIKTNYAAAVLRKVGKGQVLWLAAPVEAVPLDLHRKVFSALIRKLLPQEPTVQAECPSGVEILLYRQQDKNRFRVCVINTQETLHPVPVCEIQIKISLRGETIRRVVSLPDYAELPFRQEEDILSFELPRVEHLYMVGIEF